MAVKCDQVGQVGKKLLKTFNHMLGFAFKSGFSSILIDLFFLDQIEINPDT